MVTVAIFTHGSALTAWLLSLGEKGKIPIVEHIDRTYYTMDITLLIIILDAIFVLASENENAKWMKLFVDFLRKTQVIEKIVFTNTRQKS